MIVSNRCAHFVGIPKTLWNSSSHPSLKPHLNLSKLHWTSFMSFYSFIFSTKSTIAFWIPFQMKIILYRKQYQTRQPSSNSSSNCVSSGVNSPFCIKSSLLWVLNWLRDYLNKNLNCIFPHPLRLLLKQTHAVMQLKRTTWKRIKTKRLFHMITIAWFWGRFTQSQTLTTSMLRMSM